MYRKRYGSKVLIITQAHKVRTLSAILENIRWFAGTHIRNVAAIAGNIVTASPISDLNPVWVALVCTRLAPGILVHEPISDMVYIGGSFKSSIEEGRRSYHSNEGILPWVS
jgi:hypothetical protein